jgi:excisionase family DNA binding protein
MKSLPTVDASKGEWLGLSAGARYLGVHPITLRRWADHGEIAVMLTPGGHRRFASADLQTFAAAHKQLRTPVRLEQSWADEALLHTRREMVSQREQPWLAAFSETDRQKERELGHRLMGLMLQYVAVAEGGDDLLQEAQTIGQAYAGNALKLDLSLVEALQAMLFFRDAMVEAAVQMPEAARARPEASARLVRRINRLLNAVQLSIASVYDQRKR